MQDVSLDNHIELSRKNMRNSSTVAICPYVVSVGMQELSPYINDRKIEVKITNVGDALEKKALLWPRILWLLPKIKSEKRHGR